MPNLETLEIQTAESGRQFRMVTLKKHLNGWLYIFKYEDNNELKGLLIDSLGKKSALNNERCKEAFNN